MKQPIYNHDNKMHNEEWVSSLVFIYGIVSKNFIICLLFLLAILSSSCNNKAVQRELTIKNISSDSICIVYTEIFPDTTLDCRLAGIGIGANQECQLFLRNGWESELVRIGVLQLFIIDYNIWNTESCDTIKKYNKILKRYQLTLDDMTNLNWTITYP